MQVLVLDLHLFSLVGELGFDSDIIPWSFDCFVRILFNGPKLSRRFLVFFDVFKIFRSFLSGWKLHLQFGYEQFVLTGSGDNVIVSMMIRWLLKKFQNFKILASNWSLT